MPFTSLIPKLLLLQFLIACSMQKWREKAWGILSYDLQHDHHICFHTSSHQPSDIRPRPILHSVLHVATRWDKHQQRAMLSVWNIPRLKAMTPKGCRVTYPAVMAIICTWSKSWHYLELHCLYLSHLSAVKLQPWICFTGRTYFSSGTCFSSLASL